MHIGLYYSLSPCSTLEVFQFCDGCYKYRLVQCHRLCCLVLKIILHWICLDLWFTYNLHGRNVVLMLVLWFYKSTLFARCFLRFYWWGKHAFSKQQTALRLSHFQWQNYRSPFSHAFCKEVNFLLCLNEIFYQNNILISEFLSPS